MSNVIDLFEIIKNKEVKQPLSAKKIGKKEDDTDYYALELDEFFNNTKLIRRHLENQLNKDLHKRVEVFCSRTGKSEFFFEVHIFDYNGFDYEYITLIYKPESSVDDYLNAVLYVYYDTKLKKEYVKKYELSPNEKLFLTWIQSTGMDKFYSLSMEGVIWTEVDKIGFLEDEYDEVYIQDFAAMYDGNNCTLFNEEQGKFVLTNKKFEKS